jgi:3-oxoacyl-[acyl-carrier protein] reductase
MKQVALVTGGSGNLGQAICKQLAKDGYVIALHYRGDDDKPHAIKCFIESHGGSCFIYKCDFLEPRKIELMFHNIEQQLGRIDVLINNAGIDGGRFQIDKTPLDVHEAVLAVNYFAAVECIRLASQIMKKRGLAGRIVNISSQAAIYGGYNLSHYAASKAALSGYSIGAAKQLMQDNIRLNSISPGVVESDKLTTDKVKSLLSEIPANRLATPDDIASVVSWLVSDSAAYVSGATIPVTGAR